MSDQEFTPDWTGESSVSPPEVGEHILAVELTKCEFGKSQNGKEFMKLDAEITEGPYQGFPFDFRVYLTSKSEKIARWFLKKFSYPDELLNRKPPLIRVANIVGLRGKILFEVSVNDSGYLQFKPQAFERQSESEIEKRQGLPSVDVNDDLKQEQKNDDNDLGFLGG